VAPDLAGRRRHHVLREQLDATRPAKKGPHRLAALAPEGAPAPSPSPIDVADPVERQGLDGVAPVDDEHQPGPPPPHHAQRHAGRPSHRELGLGRLARDGDEVDLAADPREVGSVGTTVMSFGAPPPGRPGTPAATSRRDPGVAATGATPRPPLPGTRANSAIGPLPCGTWAHH